MELRERTKLLDRVEKTWEILNVKLTLRNPSGIFIHLALHGRLCRPRRSYFPRVQPVGYWKSGPFTKPSHSACGGGCEQTRLVITFHHFLQRNLFRHDQMHPSCRTKSIQDNFRLIWSSLHTNFMIHHHALNSFFTCHFISIFPGTEGNPRGILKSGAVRSGPISPHILTWNQSSPVIFKLEDAFTISRWANISHLVQRSLERWILWWDMAEKSYHLELIIYRLSSPRSCLHPN